MSAHSKSILMLVGAAGFYAIFGLIIPNALYPPVETASGGFEHASASLGQVMRKVVSFIAIILVGYAGMQMVKELRGKS